MKCWWLLGALVLTGCGGKSAPPNVPPAVPVPPTMTSPNENAPGWVAKGDASNTVGHRFICEGAGANEEDALSTARAICEDKICKLCGVQIESAVKTTETLDGVSMKRVVVERCRRVVREATPLARKSTDCGPTGCVAWVQIDYSEEKRERECSQLSDGDYADPAACQNAIDRFSRIEGHTAASFRERVSVLEQAKSSCEEIDVRPTPLMQSLEEKLSIGMTIFRKGAPEHYLRYWLASYPEMWARYRQSPRFSERLELLLGYLRHKVPLLDVLEAASVAPEVLDTPEALGVLLRVMKEAPSEKAYGVERVQWFAARRVGRQADRGHITVDLSEFNAWMRQTYAPSEVGSWSDVVAMYELFGADRVIDAPEWTWAKGMGSWRYRMFQELLRTRKHQGASRVARFNEALALALADERFAGKSFKAFDSVLPSRTPELLLAVENTLPASVRSGLTFAFFEENLPRWDDYGPWKPRRRLLDRMLRALRETKVVEPDAERFCNGLYKDFELLEKYEMDTTGLNDVVCRCLTGPMVADGSVSSANKSPLYERAMAEEMACVRPLR